MSNTNWIKAINDINSKRYVIPEGWDTREKVAESLQCSPDKVADILKPGVQCGDIEKMDFSVWDEKRRMAVKVTCYRIAEGEREPKTPAERRTRRTGTLDDRIRAAILRHPDKTDREIAKVVYGARSADVAAVRKP